MKLRKQKIVETYNQETGEVLVERSHYHINAPSLPKYMIMFVQDLSYMHLLPKNVIQVMVELFHFIDYTTSRIYINAFMKEQISTVTGLKVQTITQALSTLHKSQMLVKLGRGTFMLNPHYFAIGNMQKVMKQQSEIRLTFIYTPKGRKTKVEIE